MTVLIYASHGDSPYDLFFLNHFLIDHRVYLLTFNEKPTCVPAGVTTVRIPEPFHPMSSLLTALNTYLGSFVRSIFLRFRLGQIKHDVLISCGGLLYGLYSALSNSSHTVLFVWGSDVLVAPEFPPFRFMAKYSLRKASAVVVDSDVQEKACIALGCNPKKIVKFPWVDLQPILDRISGNREEEKTEDLKRKIGWNQTDTVIISTRWHRPIYNVECLIQAIPQIVKEIPTARFLILGNGDLTEMLKETAAKMGVGANVRFMGRVPFDEMESYLKMADIYVSTSLSDGTSASLVEAMACKVPAVVTDIPGNKEWITDGGNGLLFPTKDSRTLADKIIRLSKDANLRNALAERAFQTVCKKADWQRNSKLLDKLISSMSTLK